MSSDQTYAAIKLAGGTWAGAASEGGPTVGPSNNRGPINGGYSIAWSCDDEIWIARGVWTTTNYKVARQ